MVADQTVPENDGGKRHESRHGIDGMEAGGGKIALPLEAAPQPGKYPKCRQYHGGHQQKIAYVENHCTLSQGSTNIRKKQLDSGPPGAGRQTSV